MLFKDIASCVRLKKDKNLSVDDDGFEQYDTNLLNNQEMVAKIDDGEFPVLCIQYRGGDTILVVLGRDGEVEGEVDHPIDEDLFLGIYTRTLTSYW